METSVAWMVGCEVKPGQLETFKELMAEMVAGTSEEPGARNYEFYLSEDGGSVHLWEKYADSEATLSHVKGFAEKWAGRFMECVDMKSFVVYGTPNDELREVLTGWHPRYFAPLGGFAR